MRGGPPEVLDDPDAPIGGYDDLDDLDDDLLDHEDDPAGGRERVAFPRLLSRTSPTSRMRRRPKRSA